MFEATAALGGLDVKLVYYRGFNECKASRWMTSAADLHRVMRAVHCVGGETQIERVLAHALTETKKQRVNALVFVGDAMEENVDLLCRLAGELGLNGVPVFLFHEGGDPIAGKAFQQIAKLSRGAYVRFDLASAERLKELLARRRGLCRRRLSCADRLRREEGRRRVAAHGAITRVMLYLIGGVVLLFGLMLLGRAFVNADPKQLARFVKWAAHRACGRGGGRARRVGPAVDASALAAGLFRLLRRLHSVDWRPARTVGRGHLRGRDVLCADESRSRYRRDGRHGPAGTLRRDRLDELGRADLLALLRECRAADEEAARLVEAWLDRTDPEWRDDLHGEHGRTGAPPPRERCRYHGRGSICDTRVNAGSRRRGDQGSASSVDEAAASRPWRHRLFRGQDQPRARRTAEPVSEIRVS